MSIQNFFMTQRVPEKYIGPIIDILERNEISDLEDLKFVDINSLNSYFKNPIQIDILKKVLPFLNAQVPATPKVENPLKFSVDVELLNHSTFDLLRKELNENKVCFSSTDLVHFCSHILLRDNPGRTFTSSDNNKVVRELIKKYGPFFPCVDSIRRFTRMLGARNSNRKHLKRTSIELLNEDLLKARAKKVKVSVNDDSLNLLVQGDITANANDNDDVVNVRPLDLNQ